MSSITGDALSNTDAVFPIMRRTAQPIKKSSTLTRRASTKVAYTLSAYATVARTANVKGTAVLTLLQYAASSDSGKSRAMVAAVPAVEVLAESARHKNPPWKCPLGLFLWELLPHQSLI